MTTDNPTNGPTMAQDRPEAPKPAQEAMKAQDATKAILAVREFQASYRMECENFTINVWEDQTDGAVEVTFCEETHRFTHAEFVALCRLQYQLRWEPKP